ncbi:MAG: hypothetical protein RR382_02735, partial [Tannerellaceae bacterium]
MAGKTLSVKITGDNKEFDAALQKSANETKAFARKQAQQAKQMQRNFDMVKSSALGMAGAIGITTSAIAVIGDAIRKNMEFEKSIS